MRVLVGPERTTQHQRERHEPDAGDVPTMIRIAATPRSRHRHPELLPESIASKLQLLDRRAEHVFGDDERAFGVTINRSGR